MLTVTNLYSAYIKGAPVLHGANFYIAQGDIVAIMGRNGMGKSTFAKTVMGLMPYVTGSIKLKDNEILGLAPYQVSAKGIAIVPQGREIFSNFTVLENLRMGVIGKNQQKEDFDFVYSYFPILAERKTQVAGTMSGGQQQQLALARALVSRPELLILDEPSEGIQPNIVQEIGTALRAISASQKLTVIVIEQNIEMVFSLSHQIQFIENGLFTDRCSLEDIKQNPKLLDQYLCV